MEKKFHKLKIRKKLILISIFLLFQKSASKAKNYGPYEINTSQIAEICKEVGDIEYSRFSLLKNSQTISSVLSFGEGYMEEYFKTGDKTKIEDVGLHAIKMISWIWVFVLWSIFGLVGSLVYFIIKGIQRGVHKMKKKRNQGKSELERGNSKDNILNDAGNTNTKRQNSVSLPQKSRFQGDSIIFSRRAKCLVFCCILSIGIFLFSLAIRWSYFAFQTVGGLKRTDCAISRVYSYFEDGIKTEEAKFLGLKGYDAVFKSFEKEIGNIKAMEDHQSDVDTSVSALTTQVGSFSTKFSTYTVQSAKDIEYVIYTDTTRKMHPNTISKDIGNELQILKIGADIAFGYGVSSQRISQAEEDARKSVDFDRLLSSAKEGFDELKEFTKPFRYNVRGMLLRFFIWTVVLSLSVLTIIFLVSTCYSFKVRRYIKLSIFCQVIITVFFFTLASTINIIAVLSFGYGAIGTNICSYALDMVDKANYSRAMIPESLHSIADRCIYSGGKGDITSYSSAFSDKVSYRDFSNVFEGLGLKRKRFNITADGKSQPLPSLLEYKKHIERLQNMEEYDFKESGSILRGYRDIIPEINYIIKCTNDEVQVNEKNCTSSQISTLSDDADAYLDESYCIVLSKFNHVTLADRYKNKPCAQSAIPLYLPVKLQADQHREMLKLMLEFWDEKITPQYNTAVQKLETTMPQVEKSQNQAPNTAQFFSEDGYTYGEISDCRFIRPYLTTTMGNFCFELVINFAYQTRYLLSMGPLMTIFASCLCCAVAQTRTKDVEGDEFLVKGMVRPQGFGLDIDQAPAGWSSGKVKRVDRQKIEIDVDGFANFNLDDEEKPISRKGSDGLKRKTAMGMGSTLPKMKDEFEKKKREVKKKDKESDEIQGEIAEFDGGEDEEEKEHGEGIEGDGDVETQNLGKKRLTGKLPPVNNGVLEG